MPRIAVDSTGRSVAGVLELLKTTIAHKIANQLMRTWRLKESIRRRATHWTVFCTKPPAHALLCPGPINPKGFPPI
jgi:hypothetical protein